MRSAQVDEEILTYFASFYAATNSDKLSELGLEGQKMIAREGT
jgi:hypothetical protein